MKLQKITVFVLVLMLGACGSNKKSTVATKEKNNTKESELQQTPIPNYLANEKWELQSNLSDDFNYEFKPVNALVNFGGNKWKNFYHAAWDGPGVTYWKYDKISVDGSDLIIKSDRWNQAKESNPIAKSVKMNMPNSGISTGCITSTNKVKYPVFIEAKVSVTNLALASDVWLLSPDATQEIDIIECYGGKEPGNAYFAKSIHVSNHSFIRKPFTDYQPRDKGAWIQRKGVDSWGEYCNEVNGKRRYVRAGVYWKTPFHFEHYIDGELMRVLHHNAVATKVNGVWEYGYPTMTNGKLDVKQGKQKITQTATSQEFDMDLLQKASDISTVSIIDPYAYQGGKGYTKELDIIINVEAQDWHAKAGRMPRDIDLKDPTKNNDMKVDWIRVFKPVQ